MYNNKNVGAAFIVLGGLLLVLVAGEVVIKLVFAFLALMCIDYGLRLMGNESLLHVIRNWIKS